MSDEHLKVSTDPVHPPEDYTCFACEWENRCPWAWDWYNLHGDCLAMK